jgi:voltage-gated cation channel
MVQSIIDVWISVVFTAEAVAKIVVYGMAFGRGAYFKSPWNVLDFVTVAVSNLMMLLRAVSPASANFSYLKSLRTFRALRPIRMASGWSGMKVGFHNLLNTTL